MTDWIVGVGALVAALVQLVDADDPWFWACVVIFTAIYWKNTNKHDDAD